MPKVAYSQEDRNRIRASLVTTGLALMGKQGMQHTTVEQICKAAGISRTFFYTFFPTKEDLIVEALYVQQPRLLDYAKRLMEDPSLTWRQGVEIFLRSCCYGEKNGIAVLTIEEQQRVFRRLTEESGRVFREKQRRLFGALLECFGIRATQERIGLFTNLSLTVMIIRRAIPESLPLLDMAAAEATVEFHIRAIADCLEGMREGT